MSLKAIEELLGPPDEPKPTALSVEDARRWFSAVERMLMLSQQDREAIRVLASFAVSAPSDELLHNETMTLEAVRYAQGRKRGTDDLTFEITDPEALKQTRDWLLTQNVKETE